MSILINETTKVLVQGIPGSEGSFHASQMIEYGQCDDLEQQRDGSFCFFRVEAPKKLHSLSCVILLPDYICSRDVETITQIMQLADACHL